MNIKDYVEFDSADEESDTQEVVANSTKKCKKAYAKVTKSIIRGLELGLKKGFKDAVDNMDLSYFDTTSDAITYIVNQKA